jgi:hypothetical protein
LALPPHQILLPPRELEHQSAFWVDIHALRRSPA